MKPCLRFVSVLLLAALVEPSRSPAAPAPVQAQAACYSILTLPCVECPGVRSKVCQSDPTGLFQTCTESQSACDGSHHCIEVQTGTGAACGN